MRRLAVILLGLVCQLAFSQTKIMRDFAPVVDSLNVLVRERTSVEPKFALKSIVRRGSVLDFYFNDALSELPWRPGDEKWFKESIKNLIPDAYASCTVGTVSTKQQRISDLEIPSLHGDGAVHPSRFRMPEPKREPLVSRLGARVYEKGLSGRNIALWQSHGRYYEEKEKRWEWQRAAFFSTVEDAFTQAFVLPFLIPMLENAGAYVMTPRERDTQAYECVVDNDPSFVTARTGMLRRSGQYTEQGKWKDAGTGFADAKQAYVRPDNPFLMGSAREAQCTDSEHKAAKATWLPDIPVKGDYAVYVSYKTLENSTEAAHYTVRHLGGETEFSVNQKMGGGTWIYLGTFPFAPGLVASVELDNFGVPGTVVTADAVKIGGGMGKIARGPQDEPKSEWTVSGLPSYLEGALYWMQWAGADSTILTKHPDDYTNDFADRGAWTSMMAGGSRVNPKESGKGIPFDLSFAFHSDAGTHPNDSTVGTLAIYTLKCDGKRTYPGGGDRLAGRKYADFVQTQVVDDIRASYDSLWNRRQTWDRSYSESRTTSVPGMILELLAHQNFADMRMGLDPAFRFTVSRAVYKGMLKFLSNRYALPYEVQPLPVSDLSVTFGTDSEAQIKWSVTPDSLESTALPKGYILYTRVDDGPFDKGKDLGNSLSAVIPLQRGRLYSFRIAAYNDGGLSFPSETLSIGVPLDEPKGNVLVVNNFDRVSGPAWFDSPEYAGLDRQSDRGVPYIKDISYVGEPYEYRRDIPWTDDDNAGFGASYSDNAGFQAAGNTFDYPSLHGRALMNLGYSFSSSSAGAFVSDSSLWDSPSLDLICGKQVSTPMGKQRNTLRYSVFPAPLRDALSSYASRGGNLLVSGAYIGTDLWDGIYPVKADSTYQAEGRKFVQKVLGYKWLTNYASRGGGLWPMKSKLISGLPGRMAFYNEPNGLRYAVENPDGLLPSSRKAGTFLRYTDSNISAAVCFDGGAYKAVSLGFPLECIEKEDDLESLLGTVLKFFEK